MISLTTLHPMLVHMPIALIVLTVFFESLFLVRKRPFFGKTVYWLFQLGLLASLVGALSGWLASNTLGHDSPAHELVHDHRNLMYAATGLWLVASLLLRFWVSFGKQFRYMFRLVLLVILAIFTWGAHKGANLVFDHGIGVKPVMKTWPIENSSNHSEHRH